MSTVDATTSAVTLGSTFRADAEETATAAGASAQNLADYDDFLTLLTAQLSNQDPMDPEDSTEFVSQIATFTTVEQQINTNTKLDELIALQAGSAVDELGRYVGREVVADGLKLSYTGGEIELGSPDVPGRAQVEVVIKNERGQAMARLPADGDGGSVTWDGSTIFGSSAAPGVYSVEHQITRNGPEGEEITTETPESAGRVIEARYNDDGDVELLLEGGVALVTPEDIRAVYASPSEIQGSSALDGAVDAVVGAATNGS